MTEDAPLTPAFPNLFSPIRLGKVTLRNRIVMPGHGTRFVDLHGFHLVRRQADYLADRAKGGVAMIVQGSAMVHPTGLATGGVNEIWSDDSIPSYKMLADAVHEHGAAIFGQLSHLGRQGELLEYHAVTSVAPGAATVKESFTGTERTLLADAVVAAWYGVANDGLFHELEELGVDVRGVGDCVAPRRAIDAIWDGFRIGVEI